MKIPEEFADQDPFCDLYCMQAYAQAGKAPVMSGNLAIRIDEDSSTDSLK